MDGKGRCLDNVFVERLWRSVKYEDVYVRCYESVPELQRGLKAYLGFYNEERLHQALGTGRRRRSTGRAGVRVTAEAFLSPAHLSLGEGCAG